MSLSDMWEAAAFSSLYPCHSVRRSGGDSTSLPATTWINSKLLVSLALSEVGWEFWDMAGDRGQVRHRERTLQNQVGLSHLSLEITPWGGILCCPHSPARGQITGVCYLTEHLGTRCHRSCHSAEARSLTLRECGVNSNQGTPHGTAGWHPHSCRGHEN